MTPQEAALRIAPPLHEGVVHAPEPGELLESGGVGRAVILEQAEDLDLTFAAAKALGFNAERLEQANTDENMWTARKQIAQFAGQQATMLSVETTAHLAIHGPEELAKFYANLGKLFGWMHTDKKIWNQLSPSTLNQGRREAITLVVHEVPQIEKFEERFLRQERTVVPVPALAGLYGLDKTMAEQLPEYAKASTLAAEKNAQLHIMSPVEFAVWQMKQKLQGTQPKGEQTTTIFPQLGTFYPSGHPTWRSRHHLQAQRVAGMRCFTEGIVLSSLPTYADSDSAGHRRVVEVAA